MEMRNKNPAIKKKAARNLPVQLTFEDARKPDGRHGGWRPGAGRPSGRTTVAHDTREDFPARTPVLVTWRLQPDLESLRQERLARIILDGIRATHSTTFRITDYSILGNHLHMVDEANGKDALADGIHELANRIAKPINRAMQRSGKLFDTRYHYRPLSTPREVKNALRYVINNVRRHDADNHVFHHPDWIDPFSSGPWFDGWSRPIETEALLQRPVLDALGRSRPTAEPHTWLRRVGWQRWGLIDFDEIPGPE